MENRSTVAYYWKKEDCFCIFSRGLVLVFLGGTFTGLSFSYPLDLVNGVIGMESSLLFDNHKESKRSRRTRYR